MGLLNQEFSETRNAKAEYPAFPNSHPSIQQHQCSNLGMGKLEDLLCIVLDSQGYVIDNVCWNRAGHIGIDSSRLATAPGTHVLHCLTCCGCPALGFAILAPQSADANGYTSCVGLSHGISILRAARNQSRNLTKWDVLGGLARATRRCASQAARVCI